MKPISLVPATTRSSLLGGEGAQQVHEVPPPERLLRARDRSSADRRPRRGTPRRAGRRGSASPSAIIGSVPHQLAPRARADTRPPGARGRAAAGRRGAGVRRRHDGSTNPAATAAGAPAAARKASASVARNSVLRAVPGRRPVRPSRCRNDATVRGASIWMTRSRSPMSMPSSRVEVATMTRVRRLGEGLLAAAPFVGRERRVRHEGLDAELPQGEGELLGLAPGLAEHQPLLAAVQRGDHLGGVRRPTRRSRA